MKKSCTFCNNDDFGEFDHDNVDIIHFPHFLRLFNNILHPDNNSVWWCLYEMYVNEGMVLHPLLAPPVKIQNNYGVEL